MIKDVKNYLKELGFNKNEASIYLALTKLGEARASQVAKAAELPRTTSISILNKLAADNYITSHIYKGVTVYWIESPQVLLDVLGNKMKVAEKLKEVLPNIYRSNSHFPFAKVFDTKKSIRNFIEKTLNDLEKGAIIYTIDTPHEGNYNKIYSEDVENIILSIKKKKGIITKTLVPYNSFKAVSKTKISGQNITIKELPAGIEFHGSLWFIKDLMVNFSGNPPFLVATQQTAIISGMKNIYDFLWNQSKPIENSDSIF